MIQEPLSFLLSALADFFTALLTLRFFMQLRRISFVGQLGAFILQATNRVVIPMRRFVLKNDMSASLAAALLTQFVLTTALFALHGRQPSGALALTAIPLLVETLQRVLRVVFYLLTGALLLQALLSWINPYSPANHTLAQLTFPILQPIRRVVPLIANVDLSPLVALVLAQTAMTFLIRLLDLSLPYLIALARSVPGFS